MNLLAKRAKWLILSASILFWGCKEDVGIELPPDVQRTEVKYAEFTLPVTNVYFDSLRTDSRGVAFLGEYTDATYGTISSKVFTEYRFKSGDILDEITVNRGDYNETIEDIQLESAALVFDISNVHANSNSLNQEIEVSTLQDSIYAEGLYLRDSEIPKDALVTNASISLLEIDTIDFSNDVVHSVTIPLPNDYANLLQNQFELDSANTRMNGLLIEATSSDGVFEIDMNSNSTEVILQMRGVLYDTLGNAKKDTVFTAVRFRLNSNQTNYFSKVERDRSGTIFSDIDDKEDIDPAGQNVYLNTLAGLFPRIDLSPFIEFSATQDGVLFNRVTLEIPVEENQEFIPNQEFTQFYFSYKRQDEVTINWPRTLAYPSFLGTDYLGSIMQNDVRYLGLRSDFSPAVITNQLLSEDSESQAFIGNQVIFWQNIYQNSQDDLDGVKIENRPTVRAFLVGVDNLVMIPGQAIPLGSNTIDKESVILKVYYTQLK